MSYNPEIHHGAAEYLAWKQLNGNDAAAIINAETTTPDEYSPTKDDRYAMLVHVVNPSGGGGGGGGGSVTVNTTNLENLVTSTNTKLGEVFDKTKTLDENITKIEKFIAALKYVENNNSDNSLSVQDFETLVETTYARKVYIDKGAHTDSTDILYICHAPTGTAFTDAGWRVEKVFENGSRYFPTGEGPKFKHAVETIDKVRDLGYLE